MEFKVKACLCFLFFVLITLVYLHLYSILHRQKVKFDIIVNRTINNFIRMGEGVRYMLDSMRQMDRYEIEGALLREYQSNLNVTNISTVLNESTISTLVEDKPLLTLFTTWKSKEEKYLCHNNTLYNWNFLRPYIKPILFTDENRVREEAIRKGWDVLPLKITKTKMKIPVLKTMYLDAMVYSNSTFYAYANSDIIFTSSLVSTLKAIRKSDIPSDIPVLVVGRRTNVKDAQKHEMETFHNISLTARERGRMFTSYAEDYFITTANYPWDTMPEVVVGRVAYDNWLVWNAKIKGYTTIDATATLLAVHQTTKTGNGEGRRQPLKNYNAVLLAQMPRKMNVRAGKTSCAEYFTKFIRHYGIKVLKRNTRPGCTP